VAPLPDSIRAAIVRVWVNQQYGGSGTIIDVQGSMALVLTCAHIFERGANQAIVVFRTGEASGANVIAVDPQADLALVEIAAPRVAPVQLGQSRPAIGEPMAVAGFGDKGVFGVSRGAVASFGKLSDGASQLIPDAMCVGAPARDGDSGGPIFDAQLRLAGVIIGRSDNETSGPHCVAVRDFLQRRCPRYAVQPSSATTAAPPPSGQPGPAGLPSVQPAPATNPAAAGAADGITERLKAAFEAEKQKLLAAAEERLQAETKKLRDQVSEHLGISQARQATIDKIMADLEAKGLEHLKQAALAKKQASELNDTVVAKDSAIGILESKLATALPELAKLKTLIAAGAVLPTGLTGLLLTAIPALGGGPASWIAWGLSALAFFGAGKIKLRLPKNWLGSAALSAAAAGTLGTANNQANAAAPAQLGAGAQAPDTFSNGSQSAGADPSLGLALEYGQQLIEAHTDRSAVLDATRGRLYDTEIDQRLAQADPAMAALLNELRGTVEGRFYEIHPPVVVTQGVK
jgi:hypothetical protein